MKALHIQSLSKLVLALNTLGYKIVASTEYSGYRVEIIWGAGGVGRHVMSISVQRISRIVCGALAAAAFLLAPPTALLNTPTAQAAPVAQGCYDGVIPWNPYLKSCSLPSTQPPRAWRRAGCHRDHRLPQSSRLPGVVRQR